MPAERNLALQLIISAKDQASSVLSKLFSFLDSEVSVVAGKIRDAFSGVFGGGLDGAIEFEAQLDKVQAKGGYTAETMAQLKQAAIEIGTQFGLSGTQAAQGMESLAAAGLNATQVMQALPSVLALAKAEALSMDQASALLANSLTTVGLGFDQAARLANVLTQAANESTTSATAVGKALETAGGIARTAGLDLEQTVAVLTALAKSGIEGERAGTALAAILTQLLNPASKASEELNALNITSRDLATVIGELQSKGVNANAAILAFGETAGPGLRALISQGQQGIAELVQALLGADGAAQKAAEGMGGNLKGAMEALESTWENVKSALFDPALESLTKAARDASEALNGSLNAGALKPVQEAIKTFTENTIKAVRAFIAEFDFKSVADGLNEFAKNTESAFQTVGESGRAAADVVKIAWNAVTAGLKTLGAGITEIAASVVATLANIEEAASTVGLGSVERANALRATALEMQATAVGLIDQVTTDAKEMGEAFDRLTGSTDAAADAQRRLKDSLPVAELQTITKTLADYQGIAQRANDEAERARISYDAGTVSATQYGQALLAAAQANAELEAATQREAKAAKAGAQAQDEHAKVVAEGIRKLEQAATGAHRYTESIEGLVQAESDGIRAEIALAEAKGNTAEAQRLTRKLALQEAEGAVRVAQAKHAEQQAEYALAVAKRDQTAALVEKNQAAQQDLVLAELNVQKELAEAQAAGMHTQALEALLQKLREIQQLQQGGLQIQQQVNEQTEQNTENTNDNTDANEGNAKSYTLMENAAVGAIRELSGLSAGMEELISQMLHVDGVGRMFGHEFRGELGKLQLQLNQTNQALEHNAKIISPLVGIGFERMADAANTARKMYLEQAIAATELAGRLKDVTENAGGNQRALHDLVNNAQRSITAMRLLDQETLDRLQDAIDGANDKLREMQEETQDAKDRLQELNAELLEARGEDKKAQELRQQLEFQTDLATIEDQRRKAELTGNTELLRTLDEQKKTLEAINKIRIDNIRSPEVAERQRRVQETLNNTPARSSGGGGLATNTFNINVDGRDLLSEDQIRNKIIPVLNRATRLSK